MNSATGRWGPNLVPSAPSGCWLAVRAFSPRFRDHQRLRYTTVTIDLPGEVDRQAGAVPTCASGSGRLRVVDASAYR